ncbi:MAG TPA: hypothetical protein VNJ04_10235, partial [Gemmatimonadaceae bacterium]|nr:hypothetical protein [Gemmatimonadaceae bacterium]
MLLLAPAALIAQVGHCTKPEAQGILFLGTSLYRASGGFDAAGRPNTFGPGASFTRAQLGAYIEYGATNDITLITNISAVHLRSGSPTSTKVNTGFNNPELGAAFAIDRVKGLNKLFCAFNTMVKLPIRGGGD